MNTQEVKEIKEEIAELKAQNEKLKLIIYSIHRKVFIDGSYIPSGDIKRVIVEELWNM